MNEYISNVGGASQSTLVNATGLPRSIAGRARMGTFGRLGVVWMGAWFSIAAVAAVPDWFDPADSTLDNAQHAKAAKATAADATRGLISADVDPAHSVQAVIDTYAQCDAVFESVQAASTLAPTRAADLVQAAAINPRCPCGGDNLWSAARLSSRIRIEHRSLPVAIENLCGCSGAAAQAAALAVPEQADQILGAALAANRHAGGVVDSLGKIGNISGPVSAAGGSLTRRTDKRCAADTNPDDDFDSAQLWETASTDVAIPPASREVDCDQPAVTTEPAVAEAGQSASGADDRLLIDSYVAEGSERALVLFNGNDHAVNLTNESYQLELYFPGVVEPGRRIGLAGMVAPHGLYVVAGDTASSALRARADMLVQSSLLQPSEAVLLRRGLANSGCGCAEVTVAGTLNGLGAKSEDWRQQQVNDDAVGKLSNADSVGQVRPEVVSTDAWQSPLASAPLSLARQDNACAGDPEIADEFSSQAYQAGAPTGGVFRPSCAVAATDVVIADYEARRETADAPVWRAVELYNHTGATVDLADQGYLIEVYREGEREPRQVIALTGELARGQRLLLASDTAPDAVKDQSVLVSSDLAGDHVDAVVLKRLSVRTGGSCQANVYAALRELRSPVALVGPRVGEVSGEPTTDEPVVDPHRGGEIASPN